MTLVKQIHDLIDLAIDKGVTGYLSRQQIDVQIHAVQMDVFRKLLSEYPLTERSRNYLSPFEMEATPDVNSGVATKPLDFQHEIAVTLDDEDNTEVSIIEEPQWAFRVKDPVDPPTELHPICCFRKGVIAVRPVEVAKIRIVYFRTPAKPVYGTLPINGRFIYDEASTTDVEFSELLHNRISEKTLMGFGINLRELGISQASQAMDVKDRDL
jgi:hypothetical protein